MSLHSFLDTTPLPAHTDAKYEELGASAASAAQICADISAGLWQVVVVAIIDNLSPSQEALNVLGNSQGRPPGDGESHTLADPPFHPRQKKLL